MVGPDVALAIAIIGAVSSIAGTAISATQQSAAGEFNAAVLRQQAQREREIAGLEAETFGIDQRRLLARQRAGFAAAGVVPEAGSPLLVAEETAAEGEFQRQLILAGGATRASALETQARFEVRRGRRAGFGAIAGIGTTLLGFGSRAFGTTGAVNTTGVPPTGVTPS